MEQKAANQNNNNNNNKNINAVSRYRLLKLIYFKNICKYYFKKLCFNSNINECRANVILTLLK